MLKSGMEGQWVAGIKNNMWVKQGNQDQNNNETNLFYTDSGDKAAAHIKSSRTPMVSGTNEDEKVKVEMQALTPSILLVAGHEDLCLIARSGVGSRYLQNLVSPENKKLCEKMVSSIMTTNPFRMMTNPASCFLVEKLVNFSHILPKEEQAALAAFVDENFSKLSLNAYGYHVVLAIVTHFRDEYKQHLIIKLENPVMLISLVKSKYGTFIAQACVPCMQERTVISVANTMLGHVVELGCHSSGTFFVQKFLTTWGGVSRNLDLVVEHILRHLRDFVHNPKGHYVIQSLMNVRADTRYINIITKWLATNIMACYKDKYAVQVIRCLMYIVSLHRKDKDTEWNNVLDILVVKMMETLEDDKPLLIKAACHPVGHIVVVGLVRMLMSLQECTRMNMLKMMTKYRVHLSDDSFGEIVVKSIKFL